LPEPRPSADAPPRRTAESERDTMAHPAQTPSQPAPRRGAGGRPSDPADATRPPRFSTQSAYSRFVGAMKIVLPALAVGIVLLVLVWPRIVPDDSQFRIGLSDLAPDSADTLSMINPRFQGRDGQNRPFSIVAEKATQAAEGAKQVELTQPKADITLADGAWVALTAAAGVYHRDTKTLDLNGNVSLFHDRGFELRTARAHIDLRTGNARGDAPVQGQGPSGRLTAQGFRLEDGGQTIVFTGDSRLTIFSDALEEQP
jgi:lipopolysaccharide export system protein LptC